MNKYLSFFTLLLLLLVSNIIVAHPGRTDRNGGHNGPNGYHYHDRVIPAPTPTPAPSIEYITTAEDIRELQTLLSILNFYTEQITGHYNSATTAAANNARIEYNLSDTPYNPIVRRELLLRLRELPRN